MKARSAPRPQRQKVYRFDARLNEQQKILIQKAAAEAGEMLHRDQLTTLSLGETMLDFRGNLGAVLGQSLLVFVKHLNCPRDEFIGRARRLLAPLLFG